MKTNKLFEDVFMDIDWSLYDDETADLSGVGEKIYRTTSNAAAKWRPKTKGELIEAIEKELDNGNTDLNCIDTSEITDMSLLFAQDCYGIQLSEKQQKALDVSGWDVSNVRDMYWMFFGCENFDQDLSKWDVSNVKDMHWMFNCCINFNQDLSKWKVRKVNDMEAMFRSCKKFNQDLSGWDVSNVRTMDWMFHDCTDFNQDLSKWKVGNVESMRHMFDSCKKFNQDLSKWDVRKIESVWGMFNGCTKLKENGLIPDWYNQYKYR